MIVREIEPHEHREQGDMRCCDVCGDIPDYAVSWHGDVVVFPADLYLCDDCMEDAASEFSSAAGHYSE